MERCSKWLLFWHVGHVSWVYFYLLTHIFQRSRLLKKNPISCRIGTKIISISEALSCKISSPGRCRIIILNILGYSGLSSSDDFLYSSETRYSIFSAHIRLAVAGPPVPHNCGPWSVAGALCGLVSPNPASMGYANIGGGPPSKTCEAYPMQCFDCHTKGARGRGHPQSPKKSRSSQKTNSVEARRCFGDPQHSQIYEKNRYFAKRSSFSKGSILGSSR